MKESIDQVLLKISNVYKSFGATKAVVDVSTEIKRGEIRGLIGENGSGKSTLANLIVGTHMLDSGEMSYEGKRYSPKSVLEAAKEGIGIVGQELATINGLTIAENLFLGKEEHFARWGTVNRIAMGKRADELLRGMGYEHIKASDLIDTLSYEDRKLVELINVIADNPRILIIDETTTALSQKGRDKVYAIIDKEKKKGNSVILISHDLDEVMNVCDTVTVLRDGKHVRTLEKKEISIDYMKSLMIGRDLSEHYYRMDDKCSYSDEVVLKVSNIELDNTLKNVSLDLHKGEILGIGGLTGCGMHTLCKVIFGETRQTSGEIKVPGKNMVIKSIYDALKAGIGYIPKNRDQESLFIPSTIRENISVVSMDSLKNGIFVSRRKEKILVDKYSDLLSIKMQNSKQLVRDLSGGNRQKVAFAKWIAKDCDILVMDCPTRGIDIGVKEAIYTLIEDLKDQGKSIIMVSEELPELIGMADRIIIMKNGSISGEYMRDEGLEEIKLVHSMI